MKKVICILIVIMFNSACLGMNEIISHNQRLIKEKRIRLSSNAKPNDKLIVVTCMDTRIDPYTLFGLKAGEAHILRNAGGIVTEDTMRSIVLSMQLLGTNQVMIIEHTKCGLLGLNNKKLRADLINKFKTDVVTPEQFFGSDDLKENIQNQVKKVRNHSWIPKNAVIKGFILNSNTGALSEIKVK